MRGGNIQLNMHRYSSSYRVGITRYNHKMQRIKTNVRTAKISTWGANNILPMKDNNENMSTINGEVICLR
jgi:hypothetical protein